MLRRLITKMVFPNKLPASPKLLKKLLKVFIPKSLVLFHREFGPSQESHIRKFLFQIFSNDGMPDVRLPKLRFQSVVYSLAYLH